MTQLRIGGSAHTLVPFSPAAADGGNYSQGYLMKARRVLSFLAVLFAALAASLGFASAASAQMTTAGGTVNAGTFTVGGGSLNAVTPGSTGTVSEINLGSSRTVLNWTDFNLASGQTLNFNFASSSDIVVLKVDAGLASINGSLNARISGGTPGGNIWIVARDGVAFGAGAQVDVGGLHASTSDLTNSDFLDGNTLFSFGDGSPAGGDVYLSGRITAHGGLLSFVAPNVIQDAASTVEDATGRSGALYGAVDKYALTLAPGFDGGYDLFGLDAREATGGRSIQLNGTTDAGELFLSAAGTGTGSAIHLLNATLNVDGAAADGQGDLVLSLGGGLKRSTVFAPMEPELYENRVAQPLVLDSLRAISDVRVRTVGALTVDHSAGAPGAEIKAEFGDVTLGAEKDLTLAPSAATNVPAGQTVALAAGDQFINNRGADVVPAGARWVVYAGQPNPAGGNTYGGLHSGQTAYWGSNIDTRSPGSVSGNRYVFRHSPTLTFTADDVDPKKYGVDLTGALTYTAAGYHPGDAPFFTGDTASTAYSGSPSITSDGAKVKAMVGRSPYPIEITAGQSLNNLAGYTFAFVDGSMNVVKCQGSEPCPDADAPVITLDEQPAPNGDGWHKNSMVEHVEANGGFSGIFSLGCTLNGAPATLQNVTEDALLDGPGDFKRRGEIPISAEGRHDISCDAEDGAGLTGSATDEVLIDKTGPNPPAINPDRPAEYTDGSGRQWFRDSVTFSFAGAGDPVLADDAPGSGVNESSLPSASTQSGTGELAVGGSVEDVAGNTSAPAERKGYVDAGDPSLSITCPESVYLNGTARASITASDAETGLAEDPAESADIDAGSIGEKTLTITATDKVGNTTTKSCTTKVVYKFGGFRQPINSDGSSVFKLGSTVPVKVLLTDANGAPVPDAEAKLELSKLTSNVEGSYVEALSTSNATEGNLFRTDGVSGEYIFNLGTKSLSKGTWRLRASFDDGTTKAVDISLR